MLLLCNHHAAIEAHPPQWQKHLPKSPQMKAYKHHALILINVLSLIAKNKWWHKPIICQHYPPFIVVGRSHLSFNFCWVHSLSATAAVVVPITGPVYPFLLPPQLSLSVAPDTVVVSHCPLQMLL
jgi:hypothetical protein